MKRNEQNGSECWRWRRLLNIDGIVAGDGVLGADRVEAPRMSSSWAANTSCRIIASNSDAGVSGLLLTRGSCESDEAGDEEDNEDGQHGAQTDGQGHRHHRVATGRRHFRRRRFVACECLRKNCKDRQQQTTVRLALAHVHLRSDICMACRTFRDQVYIISRVRTQTRRQSTPPIQWARAQAYEPEGGPERCPRAPVFLRHHCKGRMPPYTPNNLLLSCVLLS